MAAETGALRDAQRHARRHLRVECRAGPGTAPLGGASNVLVVDADCQYSTSGQGLHRVVDPVDGEVYLYSQFETADAQRVFACFDQPDLKAVFTWHVTVPAHWRVDLQHAGGARGDRRCAGTKTVHFAASPRMSTYITALCAGPYHEVRDSHDGIDLGVFCRAIDGASTSTPTTSCSITKQGFDFFHEKFGVRYPLPKYDQLFGARLQRRARWRTSAASCTPRRTTSSARQVTDFEYEQRANTILHEMAHMWFGDLVTMRWWDDLWLNESFAEWASHWCNAHATRFTDAWTTFLSVRKTWGYRQDQLSSTHPVYCEMPDLEAVEVNFDGITYAKGASVAQAARRLRRGGAVPRRAARLLRRQRLGQRHLRRPAHRAGGGLRPGAAQVRRPVAGDRPGQHAAAGDRPSRPTARTPRSR